MAKQHKKPLEEIFSAGKRRTERKPARPLEEILGMTHNRQETAQEEQDVQEWDKSAYLDTIPGSTVMDWTEPESARSSKNFPEEPTADSAVPWADKTAYRAATPGFTPMSREEPETVSRRVNPYMAPMAATTPAEEATAEEWHPATVTAAPRYTGLGERIYRDEEFLNPDQRSALEEYVRRGGNPADWMRNLPEYHDMLNAGMTRQQADYYMTKQTMNPGRDIIGNTRTPDQKGMVLPSGQVLRRENDRRDVNRDIDTFFEQVVVPGIRNVEKAAEERYDEAIADRYAPKDRSWRSAIAAAIRNTPPAGAASATALVRQAGEARRERGPVRIMQEVMSGIDPGQANAYIADHLMDDPEFAAAAGQLKKVAPTPGEVSQEEIDSMVTALTPAQRRQYDKAVEQEQQRIADELKNFQQVADAAWKRQAEKFQQGIAERLVEDMARRNMPKNELEAFARTAYNASIPGMLMEWAAGSVAGDDKALHAQVMQRAIERYDPSIATRIGGEVAGLLMSSPVFSAGGSLGKAGAAGLRKLAERSVLKRLMARGITQGAQGLARRLVAGNGALRLAQAAVTSGTTLGTYDAVAAPLSAGDGTSAADIIGAAGKGFATGMLLPGIGMVAGRAANAATSRLGRYAAELGGFAAENAAFVGMGTLYEGLRTGEWGTPKQLAERFGHSVGVLGIMKSIGALKRGRDKTPGFYKKVLAETEFTPEEVEALDRTGVDGRSYKRAVFDLLNAKETLSGREVAQRAAEQLDSRYADVMQSPEVPFSAKAKLMYLVEGRIPATLPFTTDMRRTVGADGRTTVELLDPAGNLVQRRRFSSEKAAKAFERESAGVREINTIQYYETLIGRMQSLDDAAQGYAAERGIPVEAIRVELREAAEGRRHDAELVRQVAERARSAKTGRDMDIPAIIAEEVGRKYELGEGGMERALTQKEEARSTPQREAVSEYAARLKEFATRELREESPEQRAERQLMDVAGAKIERTKNRDDDVVYTATMRDGRQANIIKGAQLKYDPQTGEVDAAQSDPTVVVRFEDGSMRQVSVGEIDMIEEAVAADDAQTEALKAIRERLDASAREEALADTSKNGGMVQLKDGRIGAVEGVNTDGSYDVAVQNAQGGFVIEQVAAGDIAGPVAEDEATTEQRTASDPLLGRSLTDEEAEQVVGQMDAAAVPTPQLELTPENWVVQFGEDGKVQTPLGEVKIGENQYLKLLKKGREQYFGMIKPTLESPDIVLEEIDRRDGAERNSEYLFIKTFSKPDGNRYVHFESVTVKKDNLEVSVSSHEIDRKAFMKKMQNDRVLHLEESLFGSERRLTEPRKEGPDLVPASNDSNDKDTTTIPGKQDAGPEIPRLKNGQPDFNAMPAEMLAVEMSQIVGHEKAVERLQVAREVNAKNMEKLRKTLDGMGDLNKAMAVDQRLGAMQQEDARLSGALEQLGAGEATAADAPAKRNETFAQQIDRLFPDGLPNVRARVLADIARGQRFVWNDSPDGTKRGVATELGFTGNEGERRARFGMIGSEAAGAKYVSRYVHDLWQDSSGYAFDMDDAALRDEVIDVLLATPSRTAAMEQLHDMAERDAEDAHVPRDAEDMAAIEAYEEAQKSLRRNENNGIFAEGETQPEMYGRAEEIRRDDNGNRTADRSGVFGRKGNEPERDNDERRQTNSGGLSENTAGVELAATDRGDIRVFEEGLGTSHNEHSEYSQRDRREKESERLVAVAKKTGRYIDPKQWGRFGRKYAKRTGESVVYIDEPNGKVYKIKDPYAKAAIKGGQPEDAIYEHIVHNLLFPQTRYTFEGISEYLGDVRIVLSQNFIESTGLPDKQQIDAALAERGLFPADRYSYENELVSVTDVEGDNVLAYKDGRLYFIDPIIGLKRPAREVIEALSSDERQSEAGSGPDEAEDVPFSVSNDSTAAPKGVSPQRWEAIVEQLRRVIGSENVVTDPAAVRAAYDRITGRGMEIRRQQVAEANERFNEQLQQLTPENADNMILDLGMPSPEMLAAGIADKPLRLYGNKLLKKAEKHGYTSSDVRNLPEALEYPIAIFKGRYDGAFAILTELNIGGNNVLASIDVNKGAELNVNIITSVYGKEHSRIIRWIEQGRLLYADKKKAFDYLIPPAPMAGDPSNVRLSSEKVSDWMSMEAPLASSASDQGLVAAVKIVTNFENPKIGPENISRSIVADRTLVGVHNLTEDNVLHAIRMGGLANPSLAVIDMAQDGSFDNFGDITLVAPRRMIEKSTGKNAGTYGADIYTPRYPVVEREYGAKLKQFARNVQDFVKSHFNAESPVAKRYNHSSSYLQPQYASTAERALKREPYMQAYYAEEVLGMKVPRNATAEQVVAMIPDMTTYFEWMNDTFSSLAEREVIPNGYTPASRRRYLEHTLENVSRVMKAQGREGSEEYNYGLGSLRSHFAPRFTSLTQIRKARRRLQSPEEYRRTEQAFEQEYDALCKELRLTYTRKDSSESADDHMTSALLSKNMDAKLKQFGYQPTETLLKRMDAFRVALAQMPTEYFETKFERPVMLNEFAGAVVPDDASEETIDALRQAGIRHIEQYDPSQTGARKNTLVKMSESLNEEYGIYFMRTPEGEVYGFTTGGKIYLDSERMNAATPMHEYTELWSQIVAKERPELWSRGVELMKQTEVWRQVNADPNYKHLSENLRASETLSRISSRIFEDKQAEITEDAGLFDKLRAWIRDFWKTLKKTLSKWTQRDLNNLTFEDMAMMPVRDFVEGIDLKKYAEPINSEARFARDFTERRVTTLEKLENKRAALIAQRENIANFDELLAAADTQIEAYMQSDPVAETFGKDGVDAVSDAHLQAVEDAVYDIIRKEGVEGVQVDVIRSADALLEYARSNNWAKESIEEIKQGILSPGYYFDDNVTILASLIENRKEAAGVFWHERTHGVTDALRTSEQLTQAAEQAGVELLDTALAKRGYSTKKYPMERMADEYVSRGVEILAKKGLLNDYLTTPNTDLGPIEAYLAGRNVPELLLEYIVESCKYIKNQKYGTGTEILSRAEDNNGSATPQKSIASMRSDNRTAVETDAGVDGGGNVALRRGFSGAERLPAAERDEGGVRAADAVGVHPTRGGNLAFGDSEEAAPKLNKQQQLIAERRVTTLEKLENKRDALVADRGNIANFDERLAAVDAEIEAYMQSDPVAETFGKDGVGAASNAHLLAVEDAIYDMQRKFGIDNPVVVVRNQTEFVDRCRDLGVPETNLRYYEQVNCPNGLRIGDTLLIRANDHRRRIDAEKTLLHERAHFITRYMWMESDAGLDRLYDAAAEAGADYMNHRLEQREKSYHVDADDPESMIDGINEMISRNVDILWKKGILQKYVYAEEAGIDVVDDYMSAHNVPGRLKELILFQCEELKNGKAKVQFGKGAESPYSRLFPAVGGYAATDVAGRGTDGRGREIAGSSVEQGRKGTAGDRNGHLGGSGGRDINPSFPDNSEEDSKVPKLTKQQQLIADLRRAVRESKVTARSVAQLVSRRVRKEVGVELVEMMGKREFDALVRQIEQATARQEMDKPLQRIGEIVTDLEIKCTQKVVDDFLKLKVQGEGPRGVSVAKEVDDRTRRMFEIFRNNLDRPAAEVAQSLREQGDADRLYDLDAVSALESYQEAMRYRREVAEIEKEADALRARNTQLRRERIAANKVGHNVLFESLKKQILYNNELLDALDTERMQTKEHLAGCLKQTADMLAGQIDSGREILREWMEQEQKRCRKIVNDAFRDVDDGSKIPVLDKRPGIWTQGYRRTVDFLLSPAYSMDYLLKMISVNAPRGEGALYDHFMRGKDGYMESRGRYWLGYEDFKRMLDEKAREVFGKSYAEVVAQSNAPTSATITITNGKEQQTYIPTLGEAMYIYMANKMADGRVKLRRMKIKELEIDMLTDTLPPRFVRFADWLQEEFLPERRKTYNATHLAVFGTQMARIENYVPLKIQKSYVRQEVDGSEPDPDTLPSAITGSIIKRTRNNQILNLHTNALDLMLEHGQQMEHWNAFTRIVKDMNALLTSTSLRRMLDARNPGLHRRLKVAALLAADCYRPQTNDVNRAWIMLGKLAASSKIAFRVNTALKQVLSYPAFYAYAPSPKFWALLTKNLTPTKWAKNFKWCLDNIPSFNQRWMGRMAGNEKLEQVTAPVIDKWLAKMNKYGMMPNAFVDALTCANGAMAVYDFRRAQYLERGLDTTESDRLARIDAAIAINATQQSSEGAFIGQMQADRDFWSVSLSTFQNSNFAYLRKQLEGIDELFRDTIRERENRLDYYTDRGYTYAEALDMALKEVLAAKYGARLNLLVFAFVLNIIWSMGNNVWKYLFAPDTREEIPGALAKSAFVAPVRNTTIGSIVESFADGHGANPSVLLSDMVAFTNKLKRIVKAENSDTWNDTVAYLVIQTLTANGLGIDLESFVNMYQGIAGMIRDGIDAEDLMRVLNAPQSQAKLIAGEPREGETPEAYRERMIFTERRIAERVGKARRDKWTRNYTAFRQAEALGMQTQRDKAGNVGIPELKQLDADYGAALKQSGVTAGGKMRTDYDWQSLTAGQQERWRERARRASKIGEMEKELDTVIVYNESYARRMTELMRLKREYTEEVANDK